MNIQEEWKIDWFKMAQEGLDLITAIDTATVDDPSHSHGSVKQIFMDATAKVVDLRTMIYTGEEAKGLADQAVEKADEAAKVEEREPLSEEEKDRLWKAILESCSG